MNTANNAVISTATLVQNKSGFNKDFIHLTTGEVGELVPVMCDEIMPNTKISLGALANIQLPPLATPFRGKVDGRVEAFFVPARILWAGWKSFISRQNQQDYTATPPSSVPLLRVNTGVTADKKDFLSRFRVNNLGGASGRDINALPFLAYHKIWDDWYRDARIQKACFNGTIVSGTSYAGLPFSMNTPTFTSAAIGANSAGLLVSHQRNYAKDYYTAAQVVQQLGQAMGVTIGADGGSFTIPDIRNLNALQRYSEILAISNRYEDIMQAFYGIKPSDAVLQKPIFLGGFSMNLNPSSVTSHETMDESSTAPGDSYNPYFSFAGSQVGVSENAMGDSLCSEFTATEFGYLFVIASVVPHAFYQSGLARMFRHLQPADFANGILAGVSKQPIFRDELSNNASVDSVFAFNDRFSEYKYINDYVSGNFRSGKSLSVFALKRPDMGDTTTLSSSFITISPDALDEVRSLTADNDKSAIQFDFAFKYGCVMPLPVYTIPTLDNTADKHVEIVPTGGTRL